MTPEDREEIEKMHRRTDLWIAALAVLVFLLITAILVCAFFTWQQSADLPRASLAVRLD